MSDIPASVGAITLFVDDPERAKEFYGRVFGLSSTWTTSTASATSWRGAASRS